MQYSPNFFFIGTPKSGSSWIFECLREHPDVFVPISKDLMFFDKYFDKGLEWYLDNFKGKNKIQAAGELSHDYYISKSAARRINDVFPDAKLIVTLREPSSFLRSAYRYNRRFKKDLTLKDYVGRERVIKYLDYYNSLKYYFDLFPKENILILFYEDLSSNPQQFLRRIYSHIGVNEEFLPELLFKKVNEAKNARFSALTSVSLKLAHHLRGLGFEKLVGLLKRNTHVENILFKRPVQSFSLSEAEETLLKEAVLKTQVNYDSLEQLIGGKLPDSWLSGKD